MSEFMDRVFARVPKSPPTEFQFKHWNHGGKPTVEGVGLLPVPGADPERLLDRVMDVDHYVGNIGFVEECRAIPDERFKPPEQVRFYQRIKIPLIGSVHHELVLNRTGSRDGYEVAYWYMLEAETLALNKKTGIRGQYNDGGWIVAPGIVGYALSSAPMKKDVGFIKWKAMTTGADVGASKVLRDNIQGMAAWAARG